VCSRRSGCSSVRGGRGVGRRGGGRDQKGCGPHLGLLSGSASSALGGTSLETVLESSGHILEVASAASTDGLSSLSLLGPVVCRCSQYCCPRASSTRYRFVDAICEKFTYTCGSWQQGSRKKSTHASEREESGDLFEIPSVFPSTLMFPSPAVQRFLDSRIVYFRRRLYFEYPLHRSRAV
jgi:hypothetical protein